MSDTSEYEVAIDRTAAPMAEAADAEALLEDLADAGILPDLDGDDRQVAIGTIEEFLDRAAGRRAMGDALSFLKSVADTIEDLPNTTAARTALAKVLRGDPVSVRACAKEAKCSKSSLAKWVKTLSNTFQRGRPAPL